MRTFIRNSLPVAALTRIRARIGDFRANKRANTAIMFALCALPIVTAIGCVIDYSTAVMIKTKLQSASDAAALATVSNNSPIVATAKGMSANGTVSGGSTYATNMFSANLSSAPANVGYTGLTDSATVTLSSQTITAAVTFSANVPTYFMKILGYSNVAVAGSSTASVSLPVYLSFYLMLDVSGSMSFPSTPAEQARLMAVNPDDLHPSNSPPNNGYPQGCQFACHFATQGACDQTEATSWGGAAGPWQGTIPAPGGATNPGAGGYCQGFAITRLGTTPTSFSTSCLNDSNGSCGQYVNWTGSQVSSCSTPGTTSCIQLRADAVGYAVTQLLLQAQNVETQTGISNQFSVGLYPFIVNLCTSGSGSSNSCSVGQTTSLAGSTINNFASQLATLLDNGGNGTANSTLGSGGTHFENALSSMNTFITSSMIGSGLSSSSPLPYVFIVTDGSQDYQTQSGGNWGSQNWSASANVPYQNSATVMPPYNQNDQNGTINTTDWCATMRNRGITVAVLYIPYGTINDPNSAFSNNEDGYANSNIANIPAALQLCASSGFYFTATTPTDITNALQTMFNKAVTTAHISQ